MSQVAHQARAYPVFIALSDQKYMYFYSPLDAMLVHCRPGLSYPQHYVHRYPFIHLGGETHCESKRLAQEQNTVSLARDKRVNHEASHLPRTSGLDGKILYPNLQHTVTCPLTGENWLALQYFSTIPVIFLGKNWLFS